MVCVVIGVSFRPTEVVGSDPSIAGEGAIVGRYVGWASRWVSWGGLVCAVALGNAIAAFNWFSIANGHAGSGISGYALAMTAEIAAQRYALVALMLLLVGLRLVDRRSALASSEEPAT